MSRVGTSVPYVRVDHGNSERGECRRNRMRVDIWSDIVCPWCYVGNARFSRALADFEHGDQVEVVYRSFELDPSIPQGRATPILDVLASKYGMSQAQAR